MLIWTAAFSADLAGCSSPGEFQQDVFLATPFFGGFDAPVLMDMELLPGLFNSRAASGWARSSLHIPLACLESSPDSTCRRGLLLATLANTLRRKFCRSDLCQSPSISNQLKVYSCQFHQMLLASMESCFFSNFQIKKKSCFFFSQGFMDYKLASNLICR